MQCRTMLAGKCASHNCCPGLGTVTISGGLAGRGVSTLLRIVLVTRDLQNWGWTMIVHVLSWFEMSNVDLANLGSYFILIISALHFKGVHPA